MAQRLMLVMRCGNAASEEYAQGTQKRDLTLCQSGEEIDVNSPDQFAESATHRSGSPRKDSLTGW